jgi:hypothetical protein
MPAVPSQLCLMKDAGITLSVYSVRYRLGNLGIGFRFAAEVSDAFVWIALSPSGILAVRN